MKFIPRRDQIIGRTVIRKSQSNIISLDESKVTKFIIVDAVGDDAAAAGFKTGDLVIPSAISNIVLQNTWRPFLKEDQVMFFVTDVPKDQLLVQSEKDPKKYVPFDSPDAAVSLGINRAEADSKAAE